MPSKSSKKADPAMTSTGKKSIDAEPDDQEFDEPAVEMIGPLDDGNANGLTDAEKSHVALADMLEVLWSHSPPVKSVLLFIFGGDLQPQLWQGRGRAGYWQRW